MVTRGQNDAKAGANSGQIAISVAVPPFNFC
jgi:hypothetical protein